MRGPYVLRIDGEEHTPSSFGKLTRVVDGESISNPDELYADAVRQAERIAFDLVERDQPVEIEVVGRQGRGGRDECRAARVTANEWEVGVVDLCSPNYRWGTRIVRRRRTAVAGG